jgi:RNA polymerase sigma-B factor
LSPITAQSRHEDEQLLSAFARERKPSQLEALTERYQPLARALANRYRGGREPYEDLLQVAHLGLVKALRGYDPERRTSFTAYAVPTILGELRRHFRDRVWNLRLPRALQESTAKVEGALETLTEELGRAPTVGELAADTGLTDEEVGETLVAREVRWTSSFDAPAGGDEEAASPSELVACEEPGYDRVEAQLACSSAALDERERTAIELRFFAGMTQADVGREMGVSQMQVSRISRSGLAKLLGAVRGESEPASLAR